MVLLWHIVSWVFVSPTFVTHKWFRYQSPAVTSNRTDPSRRPEPTWVIIRTINGPNWLNPAWVDPPRRPKFTQTVNYPTTHPVLVTRYTRSRRSPYRTCTSTSLVSTRFHLCDLTKENSKPKTTWTDDQFRSTFDSQFLTPIYKMENYPLRRTPRSLPIF